MNYRLTPQARSELFELLDYIADEAGAATSSRVLLKFQNTFHKLAAFPGSGHRREDLTGLDVRFLSCAGYLVVYDPHARPTPILRIVHGSRDFRDPGVGPLAPT